MNNHENCINKEKLLTEMNKRCNSLNQKIKLSNNNDWIRDFTIKLFELENWIEKIENGEFDNE
ncbi:hypothetical protein [Spiroplasma endosymbiont of Dasysyrphus albostriatus]|uniref:hypothetical protein n=1 Tax=Spiroplasma endosymbiont of Dasysyrphus albostriatus TaxID=3066299 RepID=UPI0030D42216